MDRRHQVFVSSTYEDLREERAAVISALLQLDCIPAGMELFPAADDDSWTLIKSVIDDCDYYLAVIAGRYGSIHAPSGKSFTEMEYQYALEIGKPTIALIHQNPSALAANKSEQSDEGRRLLAAFREGAKKKNCRLWADRSELVSAVFTGVLHLRKTRPSLGWVKGNETSREDKDELLRLRSRIDELTEQLAEASIRRGPDNTHEFAQGDDLVHLSDPDRRDVSLTWDQVIRAVLPQTFGGGASPSDIANTLGGLVGGYEGFILERSEYSKVMNQMVALGLVEARPSPMRVGESLWFATPYGQQAGSRMVAFRRDEAPF